MMFYCPEDEPTELRVQWDSMASSNPFYVPVSNVAEAVLVMNVLYRYDRFEFENNIKLYPFNAGTLQMRYYGEEWQTWYHESEEYGYFDDPEQYLIARSLL